MHRVVVTGIGMVTPSGLTAEDTFDALLAGDQPDGTQVRLTDEDMEDIMAQLEIDADTPLSFPEVVEIAACISTTNVDPAEG